MTKSLWRQLQDTDNAAKSLQWADLAYPDDEQPDTP